MSDYAKIGNLDALKELRAQLVKYSHTINNALEEADGEIQHTIFWIKQDQYLFWKTQVRKFTEKLAQAKLVLQNKQRFAQIGQLPANYSFIDEKRAIVKAQGQLDIARKRVDRIKNSLPRLEKDAHNYRGMVQPLAAMAETELPKAYRRLDQMIDSIEAYLATASQENEDSMVIAPEEDIETEAHDQPVE
ncbi:MAG: hypothetical protein JEZ07_02940 [Phycisphaerae bacterium]|nr:hypothetical protein [Phycisphaerae bacterium]